MATGPGTARAAERGRAQAVAWALALGAGLLAAGVRWALEPWLAGRLPFAATYVAVAWVAWLAGPWPALLTAVAGFLGSSALLDPGDARPLPDGGEWAITALFWASSVSMVVFGAAVRRAHRRGQAAERRAREAARRLEQALRGLGDRPMVADLPAGAPGAPAPGAARGDDPLALSAALSAARASARLAAIVRDATEAIIATTVDGRIEAWNPAAERLFGAPAEEMLGRPKLELVPPDRRAEHAALWAAVRRGESRRLETTRQRRDGRPLEVLLSVSPIRDADGGVVGVSALVMDIGERKRAEAARLRSEALLRALYEGTTLCMGVVELCEDGDVLHLQDNAHSCRVFGVPPGGTAGRRATELGADAAVIADWRRHYEIAAVKGAPVSFEFEADTPAGRAWHRATVAPLPAWGDGARPRFSYISEDITARRASEQALASLNRRKTEFLATLAHELRNPLAPMTSGLAVLRLAGADAALRETTLATLERQLGLMVRLIDDLLDLGRIDRDQLELRRTTVDLAAVVQDGVETARPLLQAHGHRLALRLPAQPLRLEGDAARLTQVLANLLNNAAKYTPPGGRIGVEVCLEPAAATPRAAGAPAAAAREAVVRVCDTGVGLAPEQLERVFEMYAQVERARGSSRGGLGIGLAISRRLAQMHGGSLVAASAGLGRGSVFTLRLPLVPPAAPERPAPAPAARAARVAAGARRVLVVDDNADAAGSLVELLRLTGHVAEAAYSGTAALAAAARFAPELVLLDLGLPDLDGFAVARALREAGCLPPGARLVALTGWGQASDRERTRAAGFDRHLVKPVELHELLALLAAVPQGAAPALQGPEP